MRITGAYIHTERIETPVYVETCMKQPTGYAEYNNGLGWEGGYLNDTNREWILNKTTQERWE